MNTPQHLVKNRHDGRVLELVLNRPDRLNALNVGLKQDLVDAFTEAGNDPEVGAVVLTGAGDRAFAAGQDLEESKDFDPSDVDAWIESFENLYNAILGCPKPVVAALNGYAVGSGLQLAMVCDIRIGATTARIGMPEIDDGIPCITGTWSLYDAIGRSRTIDLILTGRMVEAEEALTWGVLSQVVAPEDLNAEAIALAARLAAKPAVAVRLNKQRMRELLGTHWESSVAAAKASHNEAYSTGVPQQLMEDFLARRRQGRTV